MSRRNNNNSQNLLLFLISTAAIFHYCFDHVVVHGFIALKNHRHHCTASSSQYHYNVWEYCNSNHILNLSNNNPFGNYTPQTPQESDNNIDNIESESSDGGGIKRGNRFSKHAPDANKLDAKEFRSELMKNMKEDLEKRRAADPTRGNQITKNYLDNI
eukprot:CAMPEP_0178956282 /NCGR_PEP_ID=MMETSP0789-20121207/10138_1 /TAXON_ID=3005 /ORGANISM="Rhizosolenia setigera, Strain CCMP 1694" /LENGTH=157 /DNA_ID=CAMNT_0020638135 /DNA_START=22 /DNA_END=495 /DNA_ORIENTATION=+